MSLYEDVIRRVQLVSGLLEQTSITAITSRLRTALGVELIEALWRYSSVLDVFDEVVSWREMALCDTRAPVVRGDLSRSTASTRDREDSILAMLFTVEEEQVPVMSSTVVPVMSSTVLSRSVAVMLSRFNDKDLGLEDKDLGLEDKDKDLWYEDKDKDLGLEDKDKDLWYEDKDKDKDLWSEDKDKDLGLEDKVKDKDLGLEDKDLGLEDKDKDLWSEDKYKDL